MQIHSYIDNAFYQSGSQFTKLNPYTLQKLHDVQSCDLLGTVAAIQAANKAFVDWKASSIDERVSLVEKFKKIICK